MKPYKHVLRRENRERAEKEARFFSCLEKAEQLINQALPDDKNWPSDEVKTALHAFVMGEFLTGEVAHNSTLDDEPVRTQKAGHRFFTKQHKCALSEAISQFCEQHKTQTNPPADKLVDGLEQQLKQWVKEEKGLKQGQLF